MDNYVAEIVISHPDLALVPTIRALSDLELRVMSQPLSDPDAPVLFYSVNTADFQRFESVLEEDHTVEDWEFSTSLPAGKIYKIQLSSRVKFLSPVLIEYDLRILEAKNSSDGWFQRMQVPAKTNLSEFWEYCQENNINWRLEKLYNIGEGNTLSTTDTTMVNLTDRQYEVGKTVTEMQYFHDDGASAEEVATELGISRSTLSTHLRRINAKLYDEYFL